MIDLNDATQFILTIVITTIVVVSVPLLLFQPQMDVFPSEHWCSNFNESRYPVLNASYYNHINWCVKNETGDGWHLNESKPMVLI